MVPATSAIVIEDSRYALQHLPCLADAPASMKSDASRRVPPWRASQYSRSRAGRHPNRPRQPPQRKIPFRAPVRPSSRRTRSPCLNLSVIVASQACRLFDERTWGWADYTGVARELMFGKWMPMATISRYTLFAPHSNLLADQRRRIASHHEAMAQWHPRKTAADSPTSAFD